MSEKKAKPAEAKRKDGPTKEEIALRWQVKHKAKVCRGHKYILEMDDVKKFYNPGQHNEVKALQGVTLKVMPCEFISIVGPSGSGKTTFLDIIGTLLKPTAGKVIIDGVNTSRMSQSTRARVRRGKIGFVFQQYNLINTFTALENVSLALRIGGHSKRDSERKGEELLKMVGLEHRLHQKTSLLSGGEQQRVAIARALANDPKIILADEPTGNLDTKTSKMILELMKWLNIEKGYTFVVVTHDPEVTKYSRKIVYLKDGAIIKELRKTDHKMVKI
jgi:putative ABC transport system ATP-binding protein